MNTVSTLEETTGASVATLDRPLIAVDVPDDAELLEDELLVEEISIDGMCGVY